MRLILTPPTFVALALSACAPDRATGADSPTAGEQSAVAGRPPAAAGPPAPTS